MSEDDALDLIHGYAATNRYKVESHAYIRMKQRNIRTGDLHNALTKARSCSIQPNGRWKVEGPELDGDDLTVIVVIENGLVVVTLY